MNARTNGSPYLHQLNADDLNARIIDAEEEIRSIDEAIARAEARLRVLDGKLASDDVIDGAAVADALLAGSQPDAIMAGGRQLLIDERDGLIAARAELRRRREQLTGDIAQARNDFAIELRKATKPVCQELTKRAREAVEGLGCVYADAQAIYASTRSSEAFALISAIANLTKSAARDLPLSRQDIPASREALALADEALSFGKAVQGGRIQAFPPPW